MFRGRENLHPERGRDLLLRLAEDVKEIGQIEQQPLLDGRNMVMVLGPTKNAGVKPDAEGEDVKRSEEAVQGDGSGQAPAPARDGEPQPQKKSSKRKTGLPQAHEVAASDAKNVKKLLGGLARCHASSVPSTRARSGARYSSRQRATTGRKNSSYRYAKEQVEHSLVYAYRDRKNKKRTFRSLWIIRINAAARARRAFVQPVDLRVAQGRHRARPQVPCRARRERSGGFTVVAEAAKGALGNGKPAVKAKPESEAGGDAEAEAA